MNTLPLRLRLRETSATELITRTQRELVDLLSHEQAPLALAQRCSGIVGSKPLFSSLLNYRWGAVDVRSEFADVGISQLATQSFTNYPITLSVLDQGEGFLLTAMTDRSVAPNRVIGFMSTALQSLLDALEHKPEQAVLTLPVLPADERHLLTNVFNATQAPYPAHKRVHQLVEEQAKRTPDVIAVVHDEYSLSYAQLDRQANRLANYLRSQGVGPDHVVGVHIERGVEMVIALLGILKAGGAYLPLDPSYPAQRLQNMLEDAQPRILLTQEKLWATLPVTQADVVALDTFLQLCGDFDVELPPRVTGLMAHDLVYVIYTSGTTGRPKGTAMSHRSMVNLLEWQRCNLPLRVGQRVLQFAALSFDVAFQEIFSTLSGGGTLVMLDEWIRRDPPALVQLLNECEIERMFVPPMMLQSIAEYCAAFSEQMPKRLRDVITAGERLHISDEVRRFFAAAPGCNLHNHYGPTETHVVTSLTLDGDPATWPTLPTIGRPIANTQIYLLDRHKQLVPAGVIGEIYIGGANVARGYLNRPELTAERFVTSSLMGESPLRLYKTGDLGRWRSGGELEYLGRNDDQVKIRGFRIEIAEIQLRLCNHPDVREAVVVACGDSANDRRLVAYIVPAHDVVVSAEQLRAHLQAGLPEHMIPAAFVMLDKLPLTPSGKLDRRALPTPGLDAYVSWSSDPPQGPLEETLARIWQELLHIDRVGRHDNFFELGGESLMAMKLLVRIADQCAVHIRILALFEYPTIAQLAKFIEGMRAQRTVTTDADATEFDEVVL